ncbi:MAG TPA: mechanosensitive ion channel family protein [Verrucomicrobiae bacterium]|nr:mechanosensitive ion channel family protein [Verrucomicrobiae bacterium]
MVLFWALILPVYAQTNTNKPAATNAPSALVQEIEGMKPVTFDLDQFAPLRQNTFLGEPLWKYVASLIYILLAFYAAKLLDLIARVWLKRVTSRTQTGFNEVLLELLHGPIKIVLFLLLLDIGLSIFDWSARMRLYLSKAFIVVIAVALTYLAIKILDLLLDVWRKRHAREADRKFNDQLFSVIRISLNTFIIVIAVLVTAQNMNIDITAAIASLSIGGLAVGLAAQDTLANLFGAVAVFVDKPFRVGDQIKIEGAEGIVETVGLRSTRVRSPDGNLIAVPNKTMGNATITNISQRPGIKTVMNFSLPHTLPTEKVKKVLASLEEIYRANPMTKDVWISVNQLAGTNLNVQVVHWSKGTDYKKYLEAMQDMNLAVKDKLEAEGVTLS